MTPVAIGSTLDAGAADRRKQAISAVRIGLVGFGFIGRQVFARIRSQPQHGMEIAFVHNRSRTALGDVPSELVLDDLARSREGRPDLVVEMAHPDYTRRWGAHFLAHANYMPLSVTALADDDLREGLLAVAAEHGTRLMLPHGALIGTENLYEWRHMWTDVQIEFRKHPDSIDFSESDFDPSTLARDAEAVVYDGPVRGIAARYPRNVNTMVTCALATVGLDRCRARLVACPSRAAAVAEIQARGRDGSSLALRKEQPMAGVSGTEMFESLFASIERATGRGPALGFV